MSEDIYFTSDTHFGHKNIVHIGRGRPWDDVEAMNEGLIERWNDRVRKQDRIYHLGDFSFANREITEGILRRLNGHIHLICGNHDRVLDGLLKGDTSGLVASYQDYKEIKVGDQRIVMFHFPILSWHQAHYGSWHLHGHCHGNLDFDNGPMLDVGVDVHGFAPLSYDEVAVRLDRLRYQGRDHHAVAEAPGSSLAIPDRDTPGQAT